MNKAIITRTVKYGIPAIGTCDCCEAENINLYRTYFHFDKIKCSCCSPNHFVLFDHCKDCVPKCPSEIRVNYYVTTEAELRDEKIQNLLEDEER